MILKRPVQRRPPARRPEASCISSCTIWRASQSVNPAGVRAYLPLLFSFGVVDVTPELGVLDDDELLGGVALDDVLVSDDAGGVPELDGEAPVPDEGGVADIDPLGEVDEGGVVDDDDEVDGDGVTVGGVVVDGVDDSRLQPAIPRTSPVQSTVTNTLFIVNLRMLMGCPPRDLADSVPCKREGARAAKRKMRSEISAVADRLHRRLTR